MKRNRVIRTLVGLAVAGALIGGVGAPTAGVAQTPCTDPNYCPTEGGGTAGSVSTIGNTPAPVGSPERAYQLRRCIAKAKAKFGDNKVKKKKAIRACRKKYGS